MKQAAEVQIDDLQTQLEEETREKLACQAKLRAVDEEKNALQEQLDEEQDEKNALQKVMSQNQVQVHTEDLTSFFLKCRC